MIHRSLLATLLALAALFSPGLATAAAADAPFEQVAFAKMLTAVQAKSLSDFVSFGDANLKATTPEQFAKAVDTLSPKLKAGYHLNYVGEFKTNDDHVYYWKVQFTGDRNDWLGKLVTANGEVKGFFVVRP